MNDKIKIASKIENISVVENLIDEISEKHKLGTEVYGNILIAVVEAVTNCIIHGNKLDGSKSVYVSYEVEKEKIQFSIKDEGDGFDYNDVNISVTDEELVITTENKRHQKEMDLSLNTSSLCLIRLILKQIQKFKT